MRGTREERKKEQKEEGEKEKEIMREVEHKSCNYKILQENIGQILWFHELAKILQRKHKSNNHKKKKCKLNFVKIKTSCSSKDIIKKIKSHATVRENIFAAHIYDKGLIYSICKEVLQFNN